MTEQQKQSHAPAPFIINGQYLKDMSFENPSPLKSLTPNDISSEINVGIDVNAQKLTEKSFELVLSFRIEGKRGEDVLFLLEIDYAGVLTVHNDVPEDAYHPLLLVEGPRMLFPYARALIAQIVQEGGFPQLNLQPIDFLALYQDRVGKNQEKGNEKSN
jgi:preprotein translocase subunit SecB